MSAAPATSASRTALSRARVELEQVSESLGRVARRMDLHGVDDYDVGPLSAALESATTAVRGALRNVVIARDANT